MKIDIIARDDKSPYIIARTNTLINELKNHSYSPGIYIMNISSVLTGDGLSALYPTIDVVKDKQMNFILKFNTIKDAENWLFINSTYSSTYEKMYIYYNIISIKDLNK